MWLRVPDYENRSFLLFIVNYVVYYFAAAVLLISWRIRTRLKREKKQALIILAAILGTIVLFNIEPFVLPLLTEYKTIVISPLFSIFWITGIGYAIAKFRLLSWSPHIEADLNGLIEGSVGSFSCRMYVKGAHRAYMDFKRFPVIDSADDVLGITLIGREIVDEKSFAAQFNVSDKEAEVMELIVLGKRTSEIAELLDIAPRTVKAHCAHIYAKLNVRNKIELFRMLERYNLMPHNTAEISVFPLLKKEKKA